ncbi:MoxR family ATPase [Candidatus Woesearchaeota archaeon]|jgi:MoxR-like ATPase|nr:MoxR family ATPase [Candidatus Woesearchaeota archaeon]MBT4247988.1 MoxR family ATPase [Candidatus Woesearchaeota archaeon]
MADVDQKVAHYLTYIQELYQELSKVVIGQEHAVKIVILSLICDGHTLLEGKPGLAKTLLVKTMASLNSSQFSRIQFTPDLLPADILGMTTLANAFAAMSGSKTKSKGEEIIKGPIFSNFVLADEINRASPKVQSALLEAMQEHQVTIGKKTYPLSKPFLVFATQNPIEESGTYELPAAQMDRFLFKTKVDYPDIASEELILDANVTTKEFSELSIKSVIDAAKILEIQSFVKEIQVSVAIKKYIVKLIDATRYPKKYDLELSRYISFGSSPRGSIGLYIAAKANALLNGQGFVLPQHVKDVAYDVLRHRIKINYEGVAEKITSDDVIKEILAKVPLP